MDNRNQFNEILKNLSSKLNTTSENIQESAQENNIDNLLKNLNPQQAQKVKSILSNPQESQKILDSPAAQAIIRKMNGNK